MKQLAIAMIVLAGGAFPAAAQEFDCTSDQTQIALNWCAGQRQLAADARLNEVWAQLRAAGAISDALLDAQRKWIAFRDADCRAMSDMFQGGSIQGMVHFNCLAEHTRRRIDDLEPLTFH